MTLEPVGTAVLRRSVSAPGPSLSTGFDERAAMQSVPDVTDVPALFIARRCGLNPL